MSMFANFRVVCAVLICSVSMSGTAVCVEPEEEYALHDLSGNELPFDLVTAARKEEMDHMLGHTFHLVDRAECFAKTGKPPISTRWIDTDHDQCGKLDHWLYGCRKAGQAWEDHYSQVLFDAGFERGTASPVTFWHECRSMWCVVHGDDFSFVGYDSDLDFIVKVLQQEYEIKVRGRLGPGPVGCRALGQSR